MFLLPIAGGYARRYEEEGWQRLMEEAAERRISMMNEVWVPDV